jgi:phospholipid/cholesterol/gamma-HCH transport system substrate-binding protein
MSSEVRTGILALVAIALTLWGIKYIQGSNIFSSSKTFYAYYDDIMGVQVGTPVQISGVSVGSVSARDLSVEDRRVRLTFTLEREVPLPKNTKAVLATTSPLGDMSIIFEYDHPCQGGTDCAEDGDTFEGVTRGLVESVLGDGGLSTYIEQLKDGIKEVVDSLNNGFLNEDAEGPLAESVRDLRGTMSNLKEATGRMNLMLQRSSPALESSLKNMASLTNTLEEQKASIASIIANTDSLSQQMVDARLDEAVNQAKATINELNATLVTAKSAMGGIDDMVGQLKAGEGTLGMLIQDEGLYNNLNALSFSLDSLMIDIQEKPYRYFPLKSRRKVEKYDRQDAEEGNN